MEGASLLLMALVYLAAGVLAVPIAQRLGLGSVLGYLVAGLAIGPSALALVGDQSSVMHFAEFGVVIMLFLIGLEVQPSVLWHMRTAFFGLGGLQVLLSGLALAACAAAFGMDWQASVALGFILSLSSTAVVLQSLEESGLRKTPTGAAAQGVLLFQDVATIPMIAALPLLADEHVSVAAETGMLKGSPAWVHAAAVIGAVAIVILVGRFLMRPAFRYIAKIRSREIFTALALLLVVGVSLLMQAVGLSAALGAFLAGVVLADSEFRREIEGDIEPFRGLLLGLFFMSVGASVNVALAGHYIGALAAAVLAMMLVKAAVVYGVTRLFGIPPRTAAQTGAALSQGGEFAFVLLGLASEAGVIAADISALAVAAVAISMALTPFALIAYERLAGPRFSSVPEPENDAMEQLPDVIIAGFGRFGQIAARLLITNKFSVSTLDASAEQVALVRNFGRRVYYGDATRLDLLRAAGAADARLLIVAIDDRDQAETLVEIARQYFPNLTVLARAYDRRHAYRLLDRGAHVIERETFEGGLSIGEKALRALGMPADQAARASDSFRRHDEDMLAALAKVWGDEEKFAVAFRESNERMNQLLAADMEDSEQSQSLQQGGDAADADPLQR
jgi:glutathione-regulated potassium-efflux system ancillary protein KefC/glutathione-regulated potassium-efflux system protein KefB